MNQSVSKVSFPQTHMQFHIVLVTLESQNYNVVDQFGTENILVVQRASCSSKGV